MNGWGCYVSNGRQNTFFERWQKYEYEWWNAWNAMAVARYSPRESHLWLNHLFLKFFFVFQNETVCQTSSGLPLGTVQHALEQNLQLQFPEAFPQPAEEQWKASEILILETIIIYTFPPWRRFQALGWGKGQLGSP